MERILFFIRPVQLVLLFLLLGGLSASAQKTTIWIVNHAEQDSLIKDGGLTTIGQQRAADLVKALKHEGIEAIFITKQKCSAQTADPLARRDKILPRVNTDSLKKFVQILTRNFAGKNVLVVSNPATIIQLLNLLGADSPFDGLDEGDHDQLFYVTIKDSGDVVSGVRYFGATNHVNAIPQQYILDNFNPNYTPIISGH